MRHLFCLLLSTISTITFSAETIVLPEAAQEVMTDYREEVDDILQKADKQITKEKTLLIKALERAKVKATKAGDLEAALAIRDTITELSETSLLEESATIQAELALFDHVAQKNPSTPTSKEQSLSLVTITGVGMRSIKSQRGISKEDPQLAKKVIQILKPALIEQLAQGPVIDANALSQIKNLVPDSYRLAEFFGIVAEGANGQRIKIKIPWTGTTDLNKKIAKQAQQTQQRTKNRRNNKRGQ